MDGTSRRAKGEESLVGTKVATTDDQKSRLEARQSAAVAVNSKVALMDSVAYCRTGESSGGIITDWWFAASLWERCRERKSNIGLVVGGCERDLLIPKEVCEDRHIVWLLKE
jgi:hypothetical protein